MTSAGGSEMEGARGNAPESEIRMTGPNQKRKRRFGIAVRVALPAAALGLAVWFFAFTDAGGALYYHVLGGLMPFFAVTAGVLCRLALGPAGTQKRPAMTRSFFLVPALVLLSVVALVFASPSIRAHVMTSFVSEMLLMLFIAVTLAVVGLVRPDLVGEIDRGNKSALRTLGLPIRIVVRAIDESRRRTTAVILVLSAFALAAILAILVAVIPGPDLVVTSKDLDFGTTLDTMQASFSSRRKGARVEWHLVVPNDAKKWLFVSPETGSATSSQDSVVTIRVRRDLLGCEGRPTRLTLEGATYRKTSFLVQVANNPVAVFSAEQIQIAPGQPISTYTVSNSGANLLNVRCVAVCERGGAPVASDLAAYLTIEPTLFSCPPGKTQGLEISVAWDTLPHRAAPYTADLVLSFGCREEGKEKRIPLTVSNPPPELAVEPAIVDVRQGIPNTEPVQVTLRNPGLVPTSWAFPHELPGWVSEVSPPDGYLRPGASETVTVTIAACRLPTTCQTQSIPIHLTDTGKNVNAVFDLRPSCPALSVFPAVLDIGDADSGALWVRNAGCGILEWELLSWEDVTEDDDIDKNGIPDWVASVEPIKGRCTEDDGPDAVTIRANRRNIPSGCRSATLRFQRVGDTGNTQTAHVKLNVRPELVLSSRKLSFGYFSDGGTFAVKNVGAGPLTWEIVVPDAGWIRSVDPRHGTTDVESSRDVLVTIDRSKMGETLESASLLVVPTDGGRQKTIEIEAKSTDFWRLDFQMPLATAGASLLCAGLGIGVAERFPDWDRGVMYSWPLSEGPSSGALSLSLGYRAALAAGCARLAVVCAAGSRVSQSHDGVPYHAAFLCVGLAAEYETPAIHLKDDSVSLGVCVSAGYSLGEKQLQCGLSACIHLVKSHHPTP